MDRSKTSIAVIGGGPAGMAALKELRDLGFNVSLFERRSDVGGIWSWSEDRSITTALKETKLCNSKFSLALTDFPMPKEYPALLSSQQMGQYLRSYAQKYDLYKNIQFGKTVTRLQRAPEASKWKLTFADQPEATQAFDKVVWATGGFLNPKTVVFDGQDKFAGRVTHSQNVRNMEDFKGQNVIVLGIGNTAGDIAISLVHHAKKVYIAHKRGAKIVKRTGVDGLPTDLLASSSLMAILWWIEAHMPWLFGKMMDGLLDNNFKENWGENKAAWGFTPPSVKDGFHTIVCNDELVPLVKEGKITSTRGIKLIIGPKTVEMDDGVIINDVDAIITCTGYSDDMAMLSEAISFVEGPGDTGLLPNLYMGIFPPEHADSFANISNVHVNGPQISARELAAIAVGQIWVGNSALPSKLAMDSWVSKHHLWLSKRIARSPSLSRGEIRTGEYMYWLHDAAGTALYDHIGWSWAAWKLWWEDREFYQALANGFMTAHANRVFETGKRPVWKGARQAVLDVNAEVKRVKETAKTKKKDV